MIRLDWITQLRLWPVKLFAPERWSVYLLLCLFAWLVGPARAAPGDLDTSFNGTGVVAGVTKDVIVLRNGRIVVASDGFSLTQYLPNGQLDTGFGTNGRVQTAILDSATVTTIAQQADLKLVAAGFAGPPDHYFIALARYQPNGQLDAGFGTAGVVTIPGLDRSSAFAIEVLPDGRLVVAAYLWWTEEIIVMRFSPTGAIDSTFGVGGLIREAHNESGSMAVQSDGSILIAGDRRVDRGSVYFLAHYTKDGAPDPNFGVSGVAIYQPGIDHYFRGGNALALQPDGKILMGAGTQNVGFGLLRYLPNGTLDPIFGDNGRVFTTENRGDFVMNITLQNNGKILAIGGYDSSAGINILLPPMPTKVARYLANGSLDECFGSNGRITTQTITNGAALALQQDGKVLVGGSKLARLLGDPTDATRAIPTLSTGALALFGVLMMLLAGWAARRSRRS